jgi:hypothetical protein
MSNENVLASINEFKKQLSGIISRRGVNTDAYTELMSILCELDDMRSKLDYRVINVNI